jgi:hypothetical protein
MADLQADEPPDEAILAEGAPTAIADPAKA